MNFEVVIMRLNGLRSYLCQMFYVGVWANIFNWLEWKTIDNVFDDDVGLKYDWGK